MNTTPKPPNPDPIIMPKDSRERELLFASLYFFHGMWSESFIIGKEGEISPNPKWWRKRKIFHKARVERVREFCNGWIAGRHAEVLSNTVSEMGEASKQVIPVKTVLQAICQQTG